MHGRLYLDRHALADFAGMEHAGARILVRRGYADAVRLLVAPRSLPTAGSLAGGREAHPVVVLPSGERAVVRRYRRGGMIRHLNRALYFGGNRAFDELRLTERARRDGVRTPTVVAAIERPARIGYTAALVTLLVPDAVDAAEWIPDATEAERRRMLTEAGRQLGRMHAAGVAHPDVNLRNLLVTATDAELVVHLLDFDRARAFPGPVPAGRRARDLRRLARSARKLEVSIGEDGWRALRDGYGSGWPSGVALG